MASGVVELEGALEVSRGRVAGLERGTRRVAESSREGRIVEQARDLPRGVGRVSWIVQQPGAAVCHELGQSAAARGDDRARGRHRLDRRERRVLLADGRQHDDVGATHFVVQRGSPSGQNTRNSRLAIDEYENVSRSDATPGHRIGLRTPASRSP